LLLQLQLEHPRTPDIRLEPPQVFLQQPERCPVQVSHFECQDNLR
jgi:hypothetical protein